jgi:general secretion pathway protein M
MADWWQQLEPRERAILAVGGALAALIVGWRLIWVPLTTRSDDLEQRVTELTRVLVDVQRAATLGGNVNASSTLSGSPMLTLIEQTADPRGLYFENQRADGNNAMYLTFRNAPFDTLNAWLTEIELDHGVSVMQVSSISFAGTPGLVNGQLLITR